jgi:hypothetical protein
LHSRLLGTAIHILLEELSRLRQQMEPAEAAQAIVESLPAVTAEIRSYGLSRAAAERLAGEALRVAQQTSLDPAGSWILAPHPRADTEARWTGLFQTVADSRERQWNLRPDRVFFAAGRASNEPVWWIIDYKTSDADGADLSDEAQRSAFKTAHRLQHQEQLEKYAHVLRSLHKEKGDQTISIRTGIYYPRLNLLDDWDA